MNRRELLGALAPIAAAAGTGAKVSVVDAEPKPLLAVLTSDDILRPEAVRYIRLQWEQLNLGPLPLLILPRGVHLSFEVDPRLPK